MAKRQISSMSKEKNIRKSTVASKSQSVSPLREQTPKHSETKEKKIKQGPKMSTPSQEQIRERAKEIWQQRGCPSGEDERNWIEAENQLKQEFSLSK